jgi:hypothetical protein
MVAASVAGSELAMFITLLLVLRDVFKEELRFEASDLQDRSVFQLPPGSGQDRTAGVMRDTIFY